MGMFDIVGRKSYNGVSGVARNAEKEAAGAALRNAEKEAAGAEMRNAAKRALHASEDAAAKEGAEKAAEGSAKQAAKKSAENATEKSGEKAAKEGAEKAGKNYVKYVAAAAAAGVGLYTYGNAADAAEASNNTPRGITKITLASDTLYNVFFTPPIAILQSDSLVISSSNTVPSIDGPQTVSSIVSDSQIVIDFGTTLTSNAAGGSIKVTTTVEAQASDSIVHAAGTVGKTVGEAAGAGAGGLFGGGFSAFFKGLGLTTAGLKKWGSILLGIFLLLGLLYYFTKK